MGAVGAQGAEFRGDGLLAGEFLLDGGGEAGHGLVVALVPGGV